MKIWIALALILLATGCTGTGGAVIGIDSLENCWNERGNLQSKLVECSSKPTTDCSVQETKIGLLEERIEEIKAMECPVCEEPEIITETEYVNETIYVNITRYINNTLYVDNNCTVELNTTNSTE